MALESCNQEELWIFLAWMAWKAFKVPHALGMALEEALGFLDISWVLDMERAKLGSWAHIFFEAGIGKGYTTILGTVYLEQSLGMG